MQTRITENDLYRSQLQQILKIDRSAAWAYEEFIRFGFPCSQQHFLGLEKY